MSQNKKAQPPSQGLGSAQAPALAGAPKRIIPCLDIKDGRIVKGVNFLNLRDAGDPVEQALIYEEAGADELVFLDIAASQENRGPILDLVKKTASLLTIPLTVGGGISNLEQMDQLFAAGVDKISISSAALKNPQLINQAAQKFGSEKIVLAMDVLDWQVYGQAGRQPTGRKAQDWALEAQERGAGEILLTSMSRDGKKDGFDLELYRLICDTVDIAVIASGGAGSMEDFLQLFKETKAGAALAASVFHFGQIEIGQLKTFLKNQGVELR